MRQHRQRRRSATVAEPDRRRQARDFDQPFQRAARQRGVAEAAHVATPDEEILQPRPECGIELRLLAHLCRDPVVPGFHTMRHAPSYPPRAARGQPFRVAKAGDMFAVSPAASHGDNRRGSRRTSGAPLARRPACAYGVNSGDNSRNASCVNALPPACDARRTVDNRRTNRPADRRDRRRDLRRRRRRGRALRGGRRTVGCGGLFREPA